MIRILLADDHPIVREGLKHLIEKDSDMSVTGEADNGTDVLSKISKESFDVIILDIEMPGRGGLDILKELKAEKPDLAILILSMYPEKQYAIRALKLGASGYLTKESAPFELVKAIRTISRGEQYISSSLAKLLVSNLAARQESHESLSNREYQIMCMICSGKTLSEIAGELFLSQSTISTYRARILEKMGLKNNSELTRYAFQKHLVN